MKLKNEILSEVSGARSAHAPATDMRALNVISILVASFRAGQAYSATLCNSNTRSLLLKKLYALQTTLK